MIRWKVVDEERNSYACTVSRYKRKYPVGKIITAKKGSFGLFCFKRKKDAENFINELNDSSTKIIKVEPLSKAMIPKVIFHFDFLARSYLDYYKNSKQISKMRWSVYNIIPNGTICYDKIKVLT
jgi:hypothetical protein